VRRSVLLTAVLSASLLLAACGNDSDSEAQGTPSPTAEATTDTSTEDEPTAEDIAALAAVVSEGSIGTAPTLTFDQPFSITAPVARLDVEGTGDVITEENTLAVNYVAISGDDGSVLYSTWDDGATQDIPIGDESLLQVLRDVLVDQRVGVRILFATPATEATDSSDAQPAAIYGLEVVSARTVPTRAEGEAVEPPAGLPVVTLADDGEPSIEIPADATEPTELVAQTLIKGSGAVVESGQTITVQYTGWLWDGTAFDSSWGSGSTLQTAIGSGSVIEGWDQGLVGQTVGSQVLLVVPSDLGYGADGSGDTIPPDSTLIFVVDILEATPGTAG
jgi:peptidylprolyl isomerase